jgi:hypothetical protein
MKSAPALALLVLAVAASPAAAQTCDSSLGIMFPGNENISAVVGTMIPVNLSLENTGSLAQTYTRLQFFPSCYDSTGTFPPTACPQEPGLLNPSEPAVVSGFVDLGQVPNTCAGTNVLADIVGVGYQIDLVFENSLILQPGENCTINFELFLQQPDSLNDTGNPPADGFVVLQSNLGSNGVEPGVCTGGGSSTDSNSGNILLSEFVADLEVTKECVPGFNPQTGEFDYTLRAENPFNPSGATLENCVVSDPGASCDGFQIPGPLYPGDMTAPIACSSPSLQNTATVICNVLGLPPSVTVQATDSAVCDPPASSFTIAKDCEVQNPQGDNDISITLTNTGEVDLVCDVSDPLANYVQNGVALPVGTTPVVLNTSVSGLAQAQLNTVTATCTEQLTQTALPPKSSNDLCEVPSFTIAKKCDAQDAQGDNDISITLTNTGDVALVCDVSDPLANYVQNGVALPVGTTPVVLNTSVSGLAQDQLNTVTAICTEQLAQRALPPKSANDLCEAGTCDVEIVKEVSCNGGPFADGIVCLAGETVTVRYVVNNTSTPGVDLFSCEVTDSNPAIGDWGPIGDIPSGGSAGPFDDADQICQDAEPGEPDTATVRCECAAPGSGVFVTDDDPSDFSCETCEIKVDKQISCSSGYQFVDVGFDDGVQESCVGWIGEDEILYRWEVMNTGTVPVTSCTLVDTNTVVGATGVIPIATALVPGEQDWSENPLLECGTALSGGEPDTATYTCTCDGFADRGSVSSSDSADLECQTADLAVTKVCDPQVGNENTVAITYTNTGTANLVNCTVSDEIYLADDLCPADVGTGTVTPVSPASGIDLAPGQSGTSTGVVFDLTADACNKATVTCEIDGAFDSTGQPKTISGMADDLCTPASDGCLTRTPGFWGTHPSVTELFLPVDVCGITTDNVLAATAGSAIEDNCFGGADFKDNDTSPQQLQLIRQCSAAALNLAATAAGDGNCEADYPGITLTFADCCSTLCNSGASGSTISDSACIEALDAFNNSNDTMSCPDSPFPFCPGLGSNGFHAEPHVCKDATGNGFVNPGRNLGPRK